MLVNTQEFRREAIYFKKYNKYPYPAPRKISASDPSLKREAQLYWDEQKKRLEEGYTVGGIRITGEHYGYLNFGQIKLLDVDEDDNYQGVLRGTGKDIRASKRRKDFDFPDFWDGDFEYFTYLEICELGMFGKELDALIKKYSFDNDPVRDNEQGDVYAGKHLIVAKSRRKGYSYKNGYMCANRYHTVPASVSLIGAYDKTYLLKADGTMQMAKNYIDFIDEHTAFTKRRLKDQLDEEIKSGYKVSGIEKGYMSSVIPLTFRNNPSAARGKDATLVLLEEAGAFPNLVEALASTADTLKDGIYVTGLCIAFGTSGGKESDWTVFEEVFYNPSVYGAMSFKNNWEQEGTEDRDECGYFHKTTKNLKGFIDKSGNTKQQEATAYYNQKIEEIKLKGGRKAVINYQRENPEKPSHAFSLAGKNIFPTKELKEHKNYLNSTNLYREFPRYGILERNEKSITLDMSKSVEPVWKFPHSDTDMLAGCYVEYYPPKLGKNGKPLPIYCAAQDPYAHDKPSSLLTKRDSLGATYIFENVNNISPDRGDKIVASIIGRPDDMDDYHKQVFYALERYNCKLNFENDRGTTKDYAKIKNKLHYLEEEPELAFARELSGKTGRNYGMHMTEARKDKAILYLNQWLRTVRGYDENGNEVLNLHYILDIGLIQELIDFTKKGNFDRCSALFILMYTVKEIEYHNAFSSQNEEIEDYFNELY